jgi:hypothetical protein
VPLTRIHLIVLLSLGACSDRPHAVLSRQPAVGERTAPPIDTRGYASSWASSRLGFIYSTSYFTRAQVDDPAWEAHRLAHMGFARICEGSHKVTRRDVRWFPPTAISGESCASVTYTVLCDTPTHAKEDTLEHDRQEMLLGEMLAAPEKGCSAKDWVAALDQPSSDIRDYQKVADAIVERPVCDLAHPRMDGPLRLRPDTRIAVATKIDAAYAARLRSFSSMSYYWFDDEPSRVIGSALYKAQRLEAIFLPKNGRSPLPSDIKIHQAIGLNGAGRPYCVQVTATQGPLVWRRTIVRSGIDGYRGDGIGSVSHVAQQSTYTTRDDLRAILHDLTIDVGLLD